MATRKARRQSRSERTAASRKVRYAVVGLGHIAQVAVLPAFAHARRNSELCALVSGDQVKLDELGQRYGVSHLLNYDEIDRLVNENIVDAAYVALPNDLHYEATVRLAESGLHVLCEKPLALNIRQCREMIDVARARGVRLMTAYRLHFDPASLAALEVVRSGRLGEVRYFNSTFSMQVTDPGNIRLSAQRGGGPVYDLGVYCINAARTFFESEPIEVMATATGSDDRRFDEVPEMVSAILRFPDDRVATFTCSFGAADTSSYRIVGTKGDLVVEPAFEYAEGLAHHLTIDGKTTRRQYSKKDQFGPELIAFSDAIIGGKSGYPTGEEGMADVRVIQAIMTSAREGVAVRLPVRRSEPGPEPDQVRSLPPVRLPPEVNSRGPGD